MDGGDFGVEFVQGLEVGPVMDWVSRLKQRVRFML